MPEPYIPQPGKPVEARWARDLILWIKNEIKPRGDGKTTIVKDNTVTALVPETSAGAAELGVLVSVPSAGSGQGTYQKITLGPGGEVIPVGDVLPVVIPKLYHYQKGS